MRLAQFAVAPADDAHVNSLGLIRYGLSTLTRGVVFAPWRATVGPDGLALLAVSHDFRLLARTEVPNVHDVSALLAGAQLIRTVLELRANEGEERSLA